MKNIFRLIFSTPLLLIKTVKKSTLNNFLGGLVLGALFSLAVNVMTVQLQELSTKQKYLESLEREIMSHLTHANTTISFIEQAKEENQKANPYSFTDRFDTTVWNSGEILNFIYDVDPIIQSRITTYYTHIIYTNNRGLDHIESSVNEFEFRLMDCLIKAESDCGLEKNALDAAANFYRESRLTIARTVSGQAFEIMEIFHPTQDRLRSTLLKLLMGEKALEILKRPSASSQ